MKYVIKSCNSRLWYVNQILIPDMLRQGISANDIILMNDNEHNGCLGHWLKMCERVLHEFLTVEGVWYLQDDILISDNFAEISQSIPSNMLCNGFVPQNQPIDDIAKTGIVSVKHYWTSFPCIYIPHKYIKQFLAWYQEKVIEQGKYQKFVSQNKYEDTLFWQFMKERNANDNILNIVPNLCQHVDYLLGGSIVNQHFKTKSCCAYYWMETDKEEKLKERLRRLGK